MPREPTMVRDLFLGSPGRAPRSAAWRRDEGGPCGGSRGLSPSPGAPGAGVRPPQGYTEGDVGLEPRHPGSSVRGRVCSAVPPPEASQICRHRLPPTFTRLLEGVLPCDDTGLTLQSRCHSPNPRHASCALDRALGAESTEHTTPRPEHNSARRPTGTAESEAAWHGTGAEDVCPHGYSLIFKK